jgi:hypothetical protein
MSDISVGSGGTEEMPGTQHWAAQYSPRLTNEDLAPLRE